jgi:PAS domain-containing protein
LLERVFDSVPYGVLISTPDGGIAFANEGAAAILACLPADLIGSSISDIVVHDGMDSMPAPWAAFWKSPETGAGTAMQTIAARRRDGVVVPVDVGIGRLSDGIARWR